jgi:hypothetical protein
VAYDINWNRNRSATDAPYKSNRANPYPFTIVGQAQKESIPAILPFVPAATALIGLVLGLFMSWRRRRTLTEVNSQVTATQVTVVRVHQARVGFWSPPSVNPINPLHKAFVASIDVRCLSPDVGRTFRMDLSNKDPLLALPVGTELSVRGELKFNGKVLVYGPSSVSAPTRLSLAG